MDFKHSCTVLLASLAVAVSAPLPDKPFSEATSTELDMIGVGSTESFQDTTSQAPTTTTLLPLRWHSPCRGGEPAIVLEDMSITAPTLGYVNHFTTLVEKSQQAQNKLDLLRNKFIQERFDKDFNHAQQLLELFFLKGMPVVQQTVSIESDSSILDLAEEAYENLARVAVFLEQARLDERRYETEGSNFASYYQEIEEQAVYWLLCQLQKFIHEIGQRGVNVNVTRDIMARPLRTVSTRALRHNRDFLIIHYSSQYMDNFYTTFDLLKQRMEKNLENS